MKHGIALMFLGAIAIFGAELSLAQGAPPAPPPAGFFYYCDAARAYFPTVETCPAGWIAIPAPPPPPMPPRAHLWEINAPESEEVVKSHPNAISLEMFGRALFYSLNYDRAVSEHISVGIGASYWETEDWWHDYIADVTVVPVYGNYYFSRRPHRGFLSAGVDWVTVTQSGYNHSTFANNGFAAVIGGGYEYLDSSGFLIRVSGFAIAGRSLDVSPSISLGYAF
jgi:hypothetical protein